MVGSKDSGKPGSKPSSKPPRGRSGISLLSGSRAAGTSDCSFFRRSVSGSVVFFRLRAYRIVILQVSSFLSVLLLRSSDA